MRTVATCGGLLLLLLIYKDAAFVVARRSPDAGPSPASMTRTEDAADPALGSRPGAPARDGCAPGPPVITRGEDGGRPGPARGSAAGDGGGGGPDPPHPGRVVASRPLAHEGEVARASGLVVCCGEVDLGDVDAGEALVVEVPWHRVGDGPLHVREVRTGCGCLVATGLAAVLAPGESGRLRLEVHVPQRAGPFEVSVQVLTDRPPLDVARVDVVGFSGHEPAFDPPTLDLGAIPRGRRVERIVSVRLPSAAPDAVVRARLVGLDGTVAVHPPWTGRRRSASRERGAELLVSPATASLGAVEGVLEVWVDDGPPGRVPVRGRVQP